MAGIGGIGGAGFAFGPIGVRLLQYLWQTKLEKAQTDHLFEQTNHLREAHIRQLNQDEVRREELRNEFENRKELQDRTKNADIEARHYQDHLHRWPVPTSAINFVRASRLSNSPLNIMVVADVSVIPFPTQRTVNGETVTVYDDGRLNANVHMGNIGRGVGRCRRFVDANLHPHVLFYDWTNEPIKVPGQAFTATLFSELKSEACAVVQVGTDDFPYIHFEVYSWGWLCARDEVEREVSRTISFKVEKKEDLINDISNVLTAITTGLIARFEILNGRKSARQSFFGTRSKLRALPLQIVADRFGEATASDVLTLLSETYVGTIYQVAERAPLAAAEAAAQGALDAYSVGDQEQAEKLVQVALECCHMATAPRLNGDANLIDEIMAQYQVGPASTLQEALQKIRGMELTRTASAATPSNEMTLHEMARAAGG
ncbi:hypothetical protein [Asticcacaulis sp. EMRT-3]|uniref:hypothetical protein n=1 Tax=Asticcacaulis sp. EMRT-3 TaxID=3040349 RepID=UPI0024AF422F|nr:hypothetical protein [Asticcacaulis sp. EMRT-3]MDI7774692.1 hypothetical protein [Asticcacaulis sp. EMRT-3]